MSSWRHNFNPDLVHAAIPRGWEISTPGALVEARLEAVDGAFRRLLGDDLIASPEMHRAAQLARRSAEHATTRIEGRPLFAGHAALPWPDMPHLVLWHAKSILREFRGDGHVALLVLHELSGIDALVTHPASGDVPPSVLRSLPADGVTSSGTLQSAPGRNGVGWPKEGSWHSPPGVRHIARRLRTRPMRWRRRLTQPWARSSAGNFAPWPGPGARCSRRYCCADRPAAGGSPSVHLRWHMQQAGPGA